MGTGRVGQESRGNDEPYKCFSPGMESLYILRGMPNDVGGEGCRPVMVEVGSV